VVPGEAADVPERVGLLRTAASDGAWICKPTTAGSVT